MRVLKMLAGLAAAATATKFCTTADVALSSSPLAASAFCSSFLSIGVSTVIVSTTSTTTTRTLSTVTETTTLPASQPTRLTTLTTKTKTTSTSTAFVYTTTITTTRGSAQNTFPAACLANTSSTISKPAPLSSYTGTSLTKACDCLSVPSSTTTSTSTIVVTVTSPIPITDTVDVTPSPKTKTTKVTDTDTTTVQLTSSTIITTATTTTVYASETGVFLGGNKYNQTSSNNAEVVANGDGNYVVNFVGRAPNQVSLFYLTSDCALGWQQQSGALDALLATWEPASGANYAPVNFYAAADIPAAASQLFCTIVSGSGLLSCTAEGASGAAYSGDDNVWVFGNKAFSGAEELPYNPYIFYG